MDLNPLGLALVYLFQALPYIALIVLTVFLIRDAKNKQVSLSTKTSLAITAVLFVVVWLLSSAI